MRSLNTRRWFSPLVFVFALSVSCTGDIVPPGTDPGPSHPRGVHEINPAPSTRAARLTHQQWANSVADLFGDSAASVAEAQAAAFRADPAVQGFLFESNGESLIVDDSLATSYQQAARAIAAAVAADPASVDSLAPASGVDRLEDFLSNALLRVFRRPPTDEELAEYRALAAMADGLYADTSGFDSVVRVTLEALLQSPNFIYRIETSGDEQLGVIPLTDYEIASRLSFAIWNTTPDEGLLEAAQNGRLTDADMLRARVESMLDDPRAEEMFVRFHERLFSSDRFWSASPAPGAYPDAPSNLPELALEEYDQVLRAAFRDHSSYGHLLTQTDTYANEELAALYGVDGVVGTEFQRIDLDPTRRRGLFTQIGFLAANATAVDPDPIHRGVFLAERVACLHLGAPPDDIPALPAPMGRTNREVIESHTETPGTNCAACHTTIINPFGFPFENYDAVGSWRDEDNGFLVDSTASPIIEGSPTPVGDAVELMDSLAASPSVHACYAGHWLQYLLARPERDEDEGSRSLLAEGSASGQSVRDLLVDILTSEAFTSRSVEELP